MLNKKLTDITETDLNELVTNSVAEGKTLEYKQELPKLNDAGKREFLRDMSSLANTSGGDLIYGIKELEGIASEVCGINDINQEDAILQLESLTRDGLNPRIRQHNQLVKLTSGKKVLIFRIEKGWNCPHCIIFSGLRDFYARDTKGKYRMDVDEIRSAFNLSSTLADKIQNFVVDRISQIATDQTALQIIGEGRVVLHLIPIDAMNPLTEKQVWEIPPDKMRPIGCSGWSDVINFEGFMTYAGGGDDGTRSYIQLYRNGIIEAVLGDIAFTQDGKKSLNVSYYESELFKSLPELLTLQKSLDAGFPIYVFITLVDCEKCSLLHRQTFPSLRKESLISKNILLMPNREVNGIPARPGKILKPIFDRVWNACGFKATTNLDDEGNWIGD
jgi:Schlafen, AlbA_2